MSARLSSKLRYCAVSVICFTLGSVLIPAFAALGLHYVLATLVAFAIVALVGFILHCRWTFQVERSFIGFWRYTGTMLLNLPLMLGLVGLAHEIAGLPVTIASPLAMATLFVWNYIAVKWAVTRKSRGTQN